MKVSQYQLTQNKRHPNHERLKTISSQVIFKTERTT